MHIPIPTPRVPVPIPIPIPVIYVTGTRTRHDGMGTLQVRVWVWVNLPTGYPRPTLGFVKDEDIRAATVLPEVNGEEEELAADWDSTLL